MLLLSDLYKQLSYGELNNLAVGMDGIGDISSAGKPKVLDYINDGLTTLYGLFNIREKQVIIDTYEYITFYHLRTRFAKYAGAEENLEEVRYIRDLPQEFFVEDVIRINRVYDSNGCELPLNDDLLVRSVFTPQPNIIQFPNPENDKAFNVVYQARHPVLALETDMVYLPDTLVRALKAFVGYKVYSHMNTQESTVKAQEHLAFYEGVVGEVEEKNLVNTSISNTTCVFEQRGFV